MISILGHTGLRGKMGVGPWGQLIEKNQAPKLEVLKAPYGVGI